MSAEFDPIIHPLNRLKICAALESARAFDGVRMKFAVLAELVDLPADGLSKQLSHLESHGYINRQREYGSTRAKDKVWVSLTADGLQAYRNHVAALREMTQQV
nr:transcriptional regulator [Corynebacterium lizhenjunii]